MSRTFKIIQINNKNVNRGRYTTNSSPSSVARKVFSNLYSKMKNKNFTFMIKETTQGSKKKVYGPYKGKRIKLKKPRMVKFKGTKELVPMRYESKIYKVKGKKGNKKIQKGGGGESEELGIYFTENNKRRLEALDNWNGSDEDAAETMAKEEAQAAVAKTNAELAKEAKKKDSYIVTFSNIHTNDKQYVKAQLDKNGKPQLDKNGKIITVQLDKNGKKFITVLCSSGHESGDDVFITCPDGRKLTGKIPLTEEGEELSEGEPFNLYIPMS